ncbi:hypothetical protein D9M73_215670 [compost metagenome]
MTPSALRDDNASRKEARLTPNCTARSRCEGKASPGPKPCSVISLRMACSATSGTAREIEFMVFQTNQANVRSVVKLFATSGKSCPMGVR